MFFQLLFYYTRKKESHLTPVIIPFDNCNSHYNGTNEEQITKQIYTLKKMKLFYTVCLFGLFIIRG